MALVPFRYNLRSLFVRAGATTLTVFSIAATVAVLAGMLGLQQGFRTTFAARGRDDLLVMMRPGATSEGESSFDREQAQIAIKEIPEIERDASGQPLASGELYLAVLLAKMDGGKTNVPIRGVQPASFAVHGDSMHILPGGRSFTPGSDEVVVGKALADRIANCRVGDVLQLNVTPFKVVGLFESAGAYQSEIWGDIDRLMPALERRNFSRILARLRPGTDVPALAARLAADKRIPANALTERAYLAGQTKALSATFAVLGWLLAVIMGIAAMFTGTNAMLSAISSRTHEIGILLATGFRPGAVFLSFLGEAMLLGGLGGLVGCLLVLPLQGMQTGTTNLQTFTEVTFAFQAGPSVLADALVFALLLGLCGGMFPAWRASRLTPTRALRRS